METDLTILANPLSPNPHPSPPSSNSEWEATVVLKCPLLNQNFVLSFEKISLQGAFP